MSTTHPSPQPTLRERRKRRTRDHIVDVATELFRSRGFERVTMADIADAAEVGSRTVFRYFGDKAEIVFADDADLDEHLGAALRQRPPGEDPWPAVRITLVQLSARWSGQHEEGRRRRALISGTPSLTARHLVKLHHHAAAIARGLEERGAAAAHARLVARTAVAAFDCAVEDWLDGPSTRALETSVRRALDLFPHAPGPMH